VVHPHASALFKGRACRDMQGPAAEGAACGWPLFQGTWASRCAYPTFVGFSV
jgi:hypothetical protein